MSNAQDEGTDHSEDHLSPMTRQALAIYRERLQAILEPEQNGRGLAIHPESGDYEVASNPTQAGHILRKRHPDGAFVTMTVGPEPNYELAGRFLAGQQSASWGKILPKEYAMSTLHSESSNQREQLPELSRLGLAYYDETLKSILEPDQNNRFVAIHVDSGDYQVAKTADDAVEAILEQHPIDGRIVVRKIGSEPEYGVMGHILAREIPEGNGNPGVQTHADHRSDEYLSPMARSARAIYRERLQAVLEPEQNGRGVAIHPESGDYAVAPTPTQAGHLLRRRHPEGKFVKMTIGPGPDYALAARFLAGQSRSGKR